MIGCQAVTAEFVQYNGNIAMEGKRPRAVAHLAYARSQKSRTGILGVLQKIIRGSEMIRCSFLYMLMMIYEKKCVNASEWRLQCLMDL